MLSYRHTYHAGNFADVMKHVVLTAILRYMTRKDAAVCYIDTHAGAGSYDLDSAQSRQTGESSVGISRLWGATEAPEAILDYLDVVRRYNPSGDLTKYPGSPWFAAKLLRPMDRLVLCELHSSDFPRLEEMFAHDRRVHCHAEDGYRFSKGLVPPIERRGLILMDPSYELRDEYETAITTIGELHRRFSTGTCALWYPILDDSRTAKLRRKIEMLQIPDVLHLALWVADRSTLRGMYGCGMIVINPPWTLRSAMEITLPWLVTRLGTCTAATFEIEQWMEE